MKKLTKILGIGALVALGGCATIRPNPRPTFKPHVYKTEVEMNENGYIVSYGLASIKEAFRVNLEKAKVQKMFSIDFSPNLLYTYYKQSNKAYFKLIDKGGFDGMNFDELRFYDEGADGNIEYLNIEGSMIDPYQTFYNHISDKSGYSGIMWWHSYDKTMGYDLTYIRKKNENKEKFEKADEFLAKYKRLLNVNKVHKEWEEKYNE